MHFPLSLGRLPDPNLLSRCRLPDPNPSLSHPADLDPAPLFLFANLQNLILCGFFLFFFILWIWLLVYGFFFFF